MIVPDINVLLYANFAHFPEHAAASVWWLEALHGREDVGLCPPVVFGLLRISTNPRILRSPLSVERALALVEGWMARPPVMLLQPGPRHQELAFGLLRQLGTGGDLVSDAQLAAFALENHAELHSADSDFGRFPGLRWVNPLKRR